MSNLDNNSIQYIHFCKRKINFCCKLQKFIGSLFSTEIHCKSIQPLKIVFNNAAVTYSINIQLGFVGYQDSLTLRKKGVFYDLI